MIKEKITERHVQAIWYDRALRPEVMLTSCGNELRVIHPGEWNLGAGPDFKDAVLEVGENRQRITGDVEVHICPSDWNFHGHGADERYRNVIAHVTWHDGPAPQTLPQGAISVWLGRLKMADPTFSLDAIDLLAYPKSNTGDESRPCELTIGRNPELAKKVLIEAGKHRLRMKARMFEGRLAEMAARGVVNSEEQVFFEEAMGALGYAGNKERFCSIARRAPIAEWPDNVEDVRTLLLVASGFEEWENGWTRPENNPQKRLAKAADIFCLTPLMEYRKITDFSRETCQKMLKDLCAQHYLGSGRVAAIIANVIVPFAIASEHIKEPPDWLPPEDISQPVRIFAGRFFGKDHNPKREYGENGVVIQGMMQVFRDWCRSLYPDCPCCPIPNKDELIALLAA